MLTASGFHVVPATSTAQETRLAELPPGQISQVPRNGTNAYVYPLPKKQLLYVGGEAQYEEFQKRQAEQKKAEEALGRARLMAVPTWSGWGAWDGPIFNPPTPAIQP